MSTALPKPARLVACAPGRVTGGTRNLLFNALCHWADSSIPLSVIDFPDGRLAMDLRERGVNFEHRPFEPSTRVRINADEVFLSPVNPAQMLGHRIDVDPNARLLLWLTHNEEFHRWFPLWMLAPMGDPERQARLARLLQPAMFRSMRRILETGLAHGGIVSMDEACRTYNEKLFGLSLPVPLLPICTSESTRAWSPGAEGTALRITWLGRLTDFKVGPLLALYSSLRNWVGADRPAVLTIIGSGEEEARVMRIAQPTPHLLVRFTGHLEIADVDRIIAEETDVGCGHGTALLEFAKLGAPALLIDGFYFHTDQGRFRWLHETTAPYVGRILVNESDLDGRRWDELIAEADLTDIGRRCRDHWAASFSPASISASLARHVNETRWTYTDLCAAGYGRPGFPVSLIQAARRFWTRNRYW